MSKFVRVPGLVGKGVALASPLLCALLAGVSMSAHADASAAAAARDVGAVRAATPMQAVVWLKGAQDAGLDATVANLYDPASPSYHRWLSSDELSAYAPAAHELATARASLEEIGRAHV